MPTTNYWIAKTEPEAYAWEQLVKDGRTAWDGVRNFEARNNLRAMKEGDLVLVYHSGESKSVVGIAKVVRTAYPDPSTKDEDWSCVDLAPVKPLESPVTLAAIKNDPHLAEIALVRRSRLSVALLNAAHFKRILKLGKTSL